MQLAHAGIETPDALKIAGVDQRVWRAAMDKGHYTCAPPAVGNKRVWTVESMMCLTWFDALCKGGMPRPLAGEMAGALSAAIAREPDAKELQVWAWERDEERGGLWIGTQPPAEAPSAQVIFVVPVSTWRSNVAVAIDNFYRRRAARKGNRT